VKTSTTESSPFIFLGGIHGVGKTTYANNEFVKLGYHCVTASSLIKNFKGNTSNDKKVTDVSDNQKALIYQLTIERESNSKILLDGHFCLINSDNLVEPICLETFKSINPDLLILLKCDPNKITKRLLNRDGKEWSLNFIRSFQEQEEKHAKLVSKELKIPLRIVSK